MPKALLHVDAENADAAEAGAVAIERQQAEAQQQTAEKSRPSRMNGGEMSITFGCRLAMTRGQADGDEGLDREGHAEALPRQIEERQVEQEEGEAEIHAEGIVEQEGDAGGAAGQQAGTGQHIEAERGNEAAGENALHILDRRVARGAGVPETEGTDELCSCR